MGKVFILLPTKSGIFLPQQQLMELLMTGQYIGYIVYVGFLQQNQYLSPSMPRVFYAPTSQKVACVQLLPPPLVQGKRVAVHRLPVWKGDLFGYNDIPLHQACRPDYLVNVDFLPLSSIRQVKNPITTINPPPHLTAAACKTILWDVIIKPTHCF